ncbi:AhpC-TSA domain-containing protein [Mycena venus]|uniref:AhpC-TSA domain-containing protein n=1 Tax=Mycena venus TaxID=2733690 RepID=A0A8H6YTL5_9AGAR|nr:AhpC-TSA domain-containing protein [Mycena venus]
MENRSQIMASSDPVQEFDSLRAQSKFVFAVFYRGHWCPFCIGWLRRLAALSPAIVAAGGTPVIVTAESEKFLKDTREASEYDRKAIVDTQNLLAKELNTRGLVSVAISEKNGYDHGMAQPALLVLKEDDTVLESWAIVPSTMNLGGAKDRPVLDEVWENVEAQLKGKSKVHETYTTTGFFKTVWGKIFG